MVFNYLALQLYRFRYYPLQGAHQLASQYLLVSARHATRYLCHTLAIDLTTRDQGLGD